MTTSRETDVVVVGGGIHGCAAAFYIARAGLSVVLLEQARLSHHASSRSAGGVRRLGRDLAEVPLSLMAMEMWPSLAETLGEPTGFRVSGQVRVAENDAEMAELIARAELMRERNYTHEELLDRDDLHHLIPEIAEHCVGGLASHADGFANPYLSTLAFANAARRAGAEIVEGARVTALDCCGERWEVATDDGQRFLAPNVLNTSGAWGARLAATLGEPVPLGYAAYMITLTSRIPKNVRPVVIGTGRPLSLKQRDDGSVMIGGGYAGHGDLDEGPPTVDVEQLSYNVATARDFIPALKDAQVVRAWAGFEGVTPDHLPVIGPSSVAPGVWHEFGFCGHGFQLAPAVASTMADLISGRGTTMAIDAFRIDRFTTEATPGHAPAPG